MFGGYASAPIPGISVKNTDLLKQMAEGEKALSMDHREIVEKGTIHGDWSFELVARTPKVYGEGDVLFGFSGGGPGYGDPLERDPELVMEDLRKNLISAWTAENIYRVAYDAERLKVDVAGTKQRRDDERKARLARGKSFDEFQKGWNKLSPPADILQFYGSWPDGKPLGPVFRP